MNGTWKVFQEVQQRHAKRMVKIMEHLLKFPEDHLLLEVLIQEEREKRKEDYDAIMNSNEAMKAHGEMQKTIDVLAREITDDTVVYFIQRQFNRLKEVRGL